MGVCLSTKVCYTKMRDSHNLPSSKVSKKTKPRKTSEAGKLKEQEQSEREKKREKKGERKRERGSRCSRNSSSNKMPKINYFSHAEKLKQN